MKKNVNETHKRKRVSLTPARNSPLGKVLEYLEATDYINFNQELENMLVARFLILALYTTDDVPEKVLQALASECIGVLQGYMKGIEQLANLEPAQASVTPLQFAPTASMTSLNENQKTSDSQTSQVEVGASAPDNLNSDVESMESVNSLFN